MQIREHEFELILRRPQMVKMLCLVLALLGLVSATSYVAGSAGGQETVQAAEPPKVTAPVAPPPPKPVEEPAAPPSRLVAGQTYLQMAAVEKGVGEVFVEFLQRKGFPTVLAPGPNEQVFRVLVGPLEDRVAIEQAQARLQAAGFVSFLRRYRVPV